jgi:hypothetical protein
MWLNPRRNCRGVGLVKRLTILRFGNLSLALWADAKRARNFRRIDQSTGVRRARASLTQFAFRPNGSMMRLVIADHAFRVGNTQTYLSIPTRVCLFWDSMLTREAKRRSNLGEHMASSEV